MVNKFDFKITATGGGSSGQADAIRLGISRALLKFNEELKNYLDLENKDLNLM